MPYDSRLADRVRAALDTRAATREVRMFGGLCFMVNGSMAVGVLKDDLVVRVGKAGWGDALARPHVRPMDFTGRPLTGLVYVSAAGTRTAAQLRRWIDLSLEVVSTLKPATRRPRPRPRPRKRTTRSRR